MATRSTKKQTSKKTTSKGRTKTDTHRTEGRRQGARPASRSQGTKTRPAKQGTRKQAGKKTSKGATPKKTGPGGRTLPAKKGAKKAVKATKPPAKKATTKRAAKKTAKKAKATKQTKGPSGASTRGTRATRASPATRKKAHAARGEPTPRPSGTGTRPDPESPSPGARQKHTVRWTENQPPPTPVQQGNGGTRVGQNIPAFSLQDQDGKTWSANELRGKPFVLYFYPKDDTTGCTKEACAFRDNYATFRERGVQVLGVSADSVQSHRKFADKYNLPFPLLADPDHALIQPLGAWQEKSMYGRKYMGIQRMTVIVGPDGKIVREYPKVKPEHHAQEILRDLEQVAIR